MHVLVIHPDPLFYRQMLPLLLPHGASGAYARSVDAACDQIQAQNPDFVVLGVESLVNGGEPEELLALLSRETQGIVVYMTPVTAEQFDSSAERAHMETLLANVSGFQTRRRLRYRQVGDLQLDVARQRATLGIEWERLPRIQFRILRYLVEHRDQLVPHTELMKAVWGYEGEAAEARELLKAHMRQIRRRLGPDMLPYIQTVRGEGYVLVDPNEES